MKELVELLGEVCDLPAGDHCMSAVLFWKKKGEQSTLFLLLILDVLDPAPQLFLTGLRQLVVHLHHVVSLSKAVVSGRSSARTSIPLLDEAVRPRSCLAQIPPVS